MPDTTPNDALWQLARAAASLRLPNLPPEGLQRTRQRVLDTLACLVAGYDDGISSEIRDYVSGSAARCILRRSTRDGRQSACSVRSAPR